VTVADVQTLSYLPIIVISISSSNLVKVKK